MFQYMNISKDPYRHSFSLEGEQMLLLGCVGKTTPDLVTLPSVVLQHCADVS